MLVALLIVACRERGTGDGNGRIDTLVPTPPDTTAPPIETCPDSFDSDGDGWDPPSASGQDCDDTDPHTFPGATDILGDYIDQDCDGVDGYAAATGCVPTGPETCNGLDDDCDGAVDDPFLLTLAVLPTVLATARLGPDQAWTLVAGHQGETATTDGSIEAWNLDGTRLVRIDGLGQSTTFGTQIATGRDLTGDGIEDLVVAAPYATVEGEPNSGRVWVFAGPLSAETTLEDAVWVFEGGELDGQPGGQLAIAPDLTGDGLPELIIGYYRHLLVFSGLPASPARIASATADIEWNSGGGAWHVASVPDQDADGLPELALGMDTWSSGSGLVAWYARPAGHLYLDDALAAVEGGGWRGIGNKLVRVGDRLYTLSGDTPIRVGVDGVLTALEGPATGLLDGGDLDGDGIDDLVLANDSGLWTSAGGGYQRAMALQSDRALQPVRDLDGDSIPDLPGILAEAGVLLGGRTLFDAPCNADGDTLGYAEGDCDDTRAEVGPVRTIEACDGLDNDCDGDIDLPAEIPWGAPVVWVTGLGDLDADGTDELAFLDAEGEATAADGETVTARFGIQGIFASGSAPIGGAGDTDGNGHVELLARGEAESWLLPLGESGKADVLATVHFREGTSWLRDGALGGAGDVDGDGMSDVWLSMTSPAGRLGIAVFIGLEPGIPTMDEADSLLVAPETWDLMNVAAATPGHAGDLDGDGLDDLLVGNPRSAYGDGRVFVFLDRPEGEAFMDDAATMRLFGDPLEGMGNAVAIGGDADGDGVTDALLGGTAASRLLRGGACPFFTDPAWPVPGASAALVDTDGDSLAEAWLGDPTATWSGVQGGVLWRARPDEDAEPFRAGGAGELLGALVIGVGNVDRADGGEIVYTTATDAVRLGGACP